MYNDKIVNTVIFAGGTGQRMEGSSIPKQFLQVGGKPILAHTIEAFQSHELVDKIVVVCYEPCIPECEGIISRFRFEKVIDVVPGGESGQDSIFNGLSALEAAGAQSDEIVLIHDGVRPLIDAQTIAECIESVAAKGCTAVTTPATETTVVIENGEVEQIIDRSKCQLARAPQGFIFGELLAAHKKAIATGEHNWIDSVSLMASCGYRIHTVLGPVENIKITHPRDFYSFKAFLDMKESMQLWER